MKLISLSAEDEKLLRAVCAHEDGHGVLATSYGLDPVCYIVSPSIAATRYRRPGSSFAQAVISWSGVLAEELLSAPYARRVRPSVPVDERNIRSWAIAAMDGGCVNSLSPEDRAGIRLCSSRYIEACETAFDKLSNRIGVLEWWTERLMNESRARFMASLIRNDQVADEADLMNLIR